MAKVSLNTVTSGYQALVLLNANWTALTNAIENTLSRDGTSPNSMGADLDMNSNDVLNVAGLFATTLTIAGVELTEQVALAEASAAAASTSETNASSSASGALASELKAEEWADKDEDSPVEASKFSALHWAAKAAAIGAPRLGSLTEEIGQRVLVAADDGIHLRANATAGTGTIFIDLPALSTLQSNFTFIVERVNGDNGYGVVLRPSTSPSAERIHAETVYDQDADATTSATQVSLLHTEKYLVVGNKDNGRWYCFSLGTTRGISWNGTTGTTLANDAIHVDPSGRVAIGDDDGHTITINGTSFDIKFGVHTEGATDVAGITEHRHSDDATLGSHVILARSRGSETSPVIVQDGDVISRIATVAYDGTDFNVAAEIRVEVDGTPGTDDMPTKVVISTTPDGANVPVDRMTIDSAGVVYPNQGIYLGGTATANLLDDYEEGTWAPTFRGTTTDPVVTYSAQDGSYTKIGELVKISCYIALASLTSSGSGTLQVEGVPFSSNDITWAPLVIGYTNSWATSTAPKASMINTATTAISFWTSDGADSRTDVSTATLTSALLATTSIYLGGSYTTSL